MAEESMVSKVLKHIENHQFGVGTFCEGNRHIYEYLLSDWNEGKVLIVWTLDNKPISKDSMILYQEVDSMLALEDGRSKLKEESQKVPE